MPASCPALDPASDGPERAARAEAQVPRYCFLRRLSWPIFARVFTRETQTNTLSLFYPLAGAWNGLAAPLPAPLAG